MLLNEVRENVFEMWGRKKKINTDVKQGRLH